ncbi:hypothetical protein [Streptomyces palmae]|uniref:hypothetical protein n=1 Tax=Streptomyces palmae TaxID=1701085 RepID=UPI001FD7FE71|nr:hypothetical protein [Streptomyces palmae]
MDQRLLPLRTALILLLASLTGVAVGILTALAGDGAPRSVLGGLAAAGLAVPFFDRVIASDPGEERRRESERAGAREGNGNG